MAPSPLSDMNVVIDESTLLDVEIDEAQRVIRLRLAVLVPSQPGDPRPERVLVLRGVSRVVVWLRRQEFTEDPDHQWSRPGAVMQIPHDVFPPDPLHDLAEFVAALAAWFGWDIYGQPVEVFDLPEPDWSSHPSLDIRLVEPDPEPVKVHSMDLALDTTPAAPDQMIDMRFEFERLDLLTADGVADDIAATAVQVREWWKQMRAGKTGGQYGIVPGRA